MCKLLKITTKQTNNRPKSPQAENKHAETTNKQQPHTTAVGKASNQQDDMPEHGHHVHKLQMVHNYMQRTDKLVEIGRNEIQRIMAEPNSREIIHDLYETRNNPDSRREGT